MKVCNLCGSVAVDTNKAITDAPDTCRRCGNQGKFGHLSSQSGPATGTPFFSSPQSPPSGGGWIKRAKNNG